MLINLNKINYEQTYTAEIFLIDRLPSHICKVDLIHCTYHIKKNDKFLLLHLHSKGELELECQRCLTKYAYQYNNVLELALCNSEDTAEELLSQYETIVIENNFVSLTDIITDELYLFTPELHKDEKDCDDEISNYIES